jgi:hypothetical protein
MQLRINTYLNTNDSVEIKRRHYQLIKEYLCDNINALSK